MLLVGRKVRDPRGQGGNCFAVGSLRHQGAGPGADRTFRPGGALPPLRAPKTDLLGDSGVELLPLARVPQPDALFEFGAERDTFRRRRKEELGAHAFEAFPAIFPVKHVCE